MGEKGAGGVESRVPTHDRSQSESNPTPPVEVAQETRDAPTARNSETQLGPEGPRRLCDVPSNSATPSNEQYPSAVAPTTLPKRTPTPSPPDSTRTRTIDPPVTKATLSELDVSKIVHNPKLRHDINFDPELHFRPNTDGDKGKKKLEKADQFWDLLRHQLALFVGDREQFQESYGREKEWCLPALLKAAKEIIQTLIPHRDREFLNEGLNVDLLMQQFSRGIADLEKLAFWLAGVLKLHCAPMRDAYVDEMYRLLSDGNRNNDINTLVKGMKFLLGVLEAMKLDVANHQIRCLRPMLIEDTMQFEQRFFGKKMASGKLVVSCAQRWYQSAQDLVADPRTTVSAAAYPSFGEATVFFDGLTRLILPSSHAQDMPNTFFFDEERINKLRSDLYDSICLEICMRRFDDLDRVSRASAQLLGRLPSYFVGHGRRDVRSGCFAGDVDLNFNSLPASRPSSLTLSDRGSDGIPPFSRNSAISICQSSPESDYCHRATDLYASLLALLQTATPCPDAHHRWHLLAEAMAVQVLRYVKVPSYASSSLASFEEGLANSVCDVNGGMFQDVQKHFHERLLRELSMRFSEYRSQTCVQIFSSATGGRINGGRTLDRDARHPFLGRPWTPRDLRDEAGLDDMATRLAHLGVLHWRVWAPLCYTAEEAGHEHGTTDVLMTEA